MSIAKTEAGLKVMKDRSVPLTPRQRSVFILIDGRRSMDEVLAASAAIGASREDVEQLFEFGLITDLSAHAGTPAPVAEAAATESPPAAAPVLNGSRSPAQRYQEAYPIATQLTASLGLRGFRLNLAVEGTSNYEQLLALAPRIRDAVGPEKFAPLGRALGDH